MTLRLMTNKTFRDLVEATLMELFPKRVKSIREKYVGTINRYNESTSDASYFDIISISGEQNEFSRSTNHPNGMFFYDKKTDAIFGIGVIFKGDAPDKPHIHIIAPRGKAWVEAVEEFIEKTERKIPTASFHVKELSANHHQTVDQHPNFSGVIVNCSNTPRKTAYSITTPSSGMRMIEESPWIKSASFKSETMQNKLLMLGANNQLEKLTV